MADGVRMLADLLSAGSDGALATRTGTVSRIGRDGTVYVRFAGGGTDMPVHSCRASVAVGDSVPVTIAKGRATIEGNESDLPASTSGLRSTDSLARSAAQDAAGAASAASVALSSAESAGRAAGIAWQHADDAATAADAAQQSADSASQAAQNAWNRAGDAATAAANAQQSADRANVYSNAALDQLGVVQDVAGILTWASEQGAFARTSDTAIVDGKVYFTFDGTDYTPVVEPQASLLSTYYELDMSGSKQAMNEYILAHLAVTNRGLWVLPAGIGSASDEQHAAGYKMLLASTGCYIYDGSGVLVRSDTASGTDFAEGRSFHFGSDDAYILYTPASGSTPASLVIGGSRVQLGSSKTLSQWEADMQQAVDDAAAALDSATLVITSTAGNLFKNGTESTVLQVAVFPNGGGRLDTIADVRARFGAGAYIEWRWRHDAEGTWGTLATSDPHLSNGGMWLTVTPVDVESKTSFEASLVVP